MSVIQDAIEQKKPCCVKCGAKLEWGGFAYNQEICWSCFTQTTRDILARINTTCYPSFVWNKIDEHRDQIDFMMAVIANVFGYEW